MVNFDFISGSKSRKPVSLSFRIPYYTHWGQSLLVCGSEPALGSWNVKKGLLLSPHHQGDELVWHGTIAVPDGFGCEYSYYVVDDDKNVLRWEAGMKRKIMLPNGLQDGEEVALRDLWQIGSDSLPFKTAFKNVIFRKQWSFDIERPLGVIQNKLDENDSVIVQFKICCPSIEEDSSIYVIGSSVKLGRWKVQDGLKLNYAGESIWQADCVMQKDDFPIKYPFFGCSCLT
ncbi:hypothetical protein CsSME_00046023 [Camellia sinensis var. sinensis]